jgi:hypothetical protein
MRSWSIEFRQYYQKRRRIYFARANFHSAKISNTGSAGYLFRQVLFEKTERQGKRAVGFRLAIGLAADPGEGVVGARIFVDGNERIGFPRLQAVRARSQNRADL